MVLETKKSWIVCKFGGTSVASKGSWDRIIARVQELLPTNRVWLTVSACSGT